MTEDEQAGRPTAALFTVDDLLQARGEASGVIRAAHDPDKGCHGCVFHGADYSAPTDPAHRCSVERERDKVIAAMERFREVSRRLSDLALSVAEGNCTNQRMALDALGGQALLMREVIDEEWRGGSDCSLITPAPRWCPLRSGPVVVVREKASPSVKDSIAASVQSTIDQIAAERFPDLPAPIFEPRSANGEAPPEGEADPVPNTLIEPDPPPPGPPPDLPPGGWFRPDLGTAGVTDYAHPFLAVTCAWCGNVNQSDRWDHGRGEPAEPVGWKRVARNREGDGYEMVSICKGCLLANEPRRSSPIIDHVPAPPGTRFYEESGVTYCYSEDGLYSGAHGLGRAARVEAVGHWARLAHPGSIAAYFDDDGWKVVFEGGRVVALGKAED